MLGLIAHSLGAILPIGNILPFSQHHVQLVCGLCNQLPPQNLTHVLYIYNYNIFIMGNKLNYVLSKAPRWKMLFVISLAFHCYPSFRQVCKVHLYNGKNLYGIS